MLSPYQLQLKGIREDYEDSSGSSSFLIPHYHDAIPPPSSPSSSSLLQMPFGETNTFVSSLSGYSAEQHEQMQQEQRLKLEDEFHGRQEESRVLRAAFQRCSKSTSKTSSSSSSSSSSLSLSKSSSSKSSSSKSSSQLVWVSGVSGIGKTSVVVETLRNQLVGQNYFCMGKFDVTRQRCEPYSALLEAFLELCDLIVQTNLQQQQHQQLCNHQQSSSTNSLETEVRILTKLISKLSTLEANDENNAQDNDEDSPDETDGIDGTMQKRRRHNHRLGRKNNNNSNNNTNNAAAAASKKASFTRFKLMCRTFLRSVSAQKPVVLFLDDLQWADEGSIRVLEGLIRDPDSVGVLIVGAYRQEELHHNELLMNLVHETTRTQDDNNNNNHPQEDVLPQQQQDPQRDKFYLPTTHLKVGALTVNALNDLITALTGVDDTESSFALSQVIWNKTHGNAYFVVQFLEMLFDRGLLYAEKHESQRRLSGSVTSSTSSSSRGSFSRKGGDHHHGGNRYMWDMERIQRETNVCDNVADLVEAKIQRLPRRVQAVLKMAACLGYTIHLDVLHDVLKDQKKPKDDRNKNNNNSGSSGGNNNNSGSSGGNNNNNNNNNNNKNIKKNKDNKNNSKSKRTPRKRLSGMHWTEEDLHRVLITACREGLVEESHQHTNSGELKPIYKFSHDRVQSVLYSQIPEGEEREILHLRIGRRLWKNIGNDTDDWLISMTADHLNRGVPHMTQDEEKIDLVQFNIHVGKLAMSKSAFVQASEYLEFGLGLFDPEYLWNNQYNLMVDLMSTLAEVYHCAGNFPRSMELIKSIISQTTSLSDRLRAYYLYVESLGADGRVAEARNIAFTVLKELGEVFPKNPNKLHVVGELIKVKAALKGRKPDFLLNMPAMKDPAKHAAMTVLSNITTHTFMSDADKNTFSLVGLRSMRLTVEHGINEWSPTGIACYAIVLTALGQYDEAMVYGRVAIKMSDQLGKRANDARHILYLEQLVTHWRRPLVDGLETFPRCYDLAMQNGDVDTGLCATAGYIGTACHTGKTLEEFEESCRLFVQQMNEYDHQTYLGVNVPMWQLALNMLGRNDDLLLLHGEAMNLNQFHAVVTAQNHALSLALVDYFHLILSVHFLAYDRMKELLPRLEQTKQVVKTHWAEYHMAFTMGMSYLTLFDKYKKRKFLRWGVRIINRFRQWVAAGVMNARPFYALLSAFKKSFFKKKRGFGHLKQGFDDSIRLFKEGGWMCYEGIANEHAAIVAERRGERALASKYMIQCVVILEDYGYQPKVDWLNARFRHLLSGKNEAQSVRIEIPQMMTMLAVTDIGDVGPCTDE